MSLRRPYKRPMTGWWRKNPYFVEYMIHEGTALCVAVYAVILLVGLMALASGEAAWQQWLTLLRSAPGLLLHGLLLVGFLYHSWTWFHIMPRTLPPIKLGGERLSAAAISNTGLTVALLASVLILALAMRLAS